MGSDEIKSTLDTEKSTVPGGSCTTSKSCWMVQVVLRLFLFAATLTSIVVMVTSKQTKTIPGIPIPREAKFTHSPAFIYFVVALSVACFYSILSTLATVSAFKKPSSCSAILLLNLAIMDAVMVGIVASATGASGGVAYIGLKGIKYVQWREICDFYDTFCRHVGGAVAVSLVASILLLLLSIISVLSLYKRIR
ncbi:CASP-like protein 1D1 [Raphanus sativus]|uniref:CASP-like protein n=1 Tax=Raphanus sativus TaxID=3726 RepID=A0A6J0LQI1_RAPSA|nr:CASP-like protein 1D1 [Raphanus sativus]KAJ4900123.1 CASP-like protein 1D1 [Raphanus sativus]